MPASALAVGLLVLSWQLSRTAEKVTETRLEGSEAVFMALTFLYLLCVLGVVIVGAAGAFGWRLGRGGRVVPALCSVYGVVVFLIAVDTHLDWFAAPPSAPSVPRVSGHPVSGAVIPTLAGGVLDISGADGPSGRFRSQGTHDTLFGDWHGHTDAQELGRLAESEAMVSRGAASLLAAGFSKDFTVEEGRHRGHPAWSLMLTPADGGAGAAWLMVWACEPTKRTFAVGIESADLDRVGLLAERAKTVASCHQGGGEAVPVDEPDPFGPPAAP